MRWTVWYGGFNEFSIPAITQPDGYDIEWASGILIEAIESWIGE